MTTKQVSPSFATMSTGKDVRVFALPEILPERVRVVLDVNSRMALLLDLDGEETAPLLHSSQLTPSAARVFLALLQAYPQHCSYQALLAVLYPSSPEGSSSAWDRHVRPIRRALVALAPVLRAFGLEVVSLRGHGYLLASAPHPSDTSLAAS
ncbi:MAG TPA: helix-turn-helix domain-containing protein [Ktedonobacteraceae bacterium]|nr:helix-turn-helix domain-containing protein [Ktedonobacteraceae bacterium]